MSTSVASGVLVVEDAVAVAVAVAEAGVLVVHVCAADDDCAELGSLPDVEDVVASMRARGARRRASAWRRGQQPWRVS